MNEQLQQQIGDILASITNAVKATGRFVLEELPLIAQEYVMYGRAYYTVTMLMLIAFLTFAFVKIPQWFRKTNEDEGYGFAAIALCFVSFFAVIGVFSAMYPFFMAWFAPKIFIIQGLVGLVK